MGHQPVQLIYSEFQSWFLDFLGISPPFLGSIIIIDSIFWSNRSANFNWSCWVSTSSFSPPIFRIQHFERIRSANLWSTVCLRLQNFYLAHLHDTKLNGEMMRQSAGLQSRNVPIQQKWIQRASRLSVYTDFTLRMNEFKWIESKDRQCICKLPHKKKKFR